MRSHFCWPVDTPTLSEILNSGRREKSDVCTSHPPHCTEGLSSLS